MTSDLSEDRPRIGNRPWRRSTITSSGRRWHAAQLHASSARPTRNAVCERCRRCKCAQRGTEQAAPKPAETRKATAAASPDDEQRKHAPTPAAGDRRGQQKDVRPLSAAERGTSGGRAAAGEGPAGGVRLFLRAIKKKGGVWPSLIASTCGL